MSPISFFNRHPRADFSAYLDGELSPEADRRLEAHTASCKACFAELESLRELRSALRETPEVQAPRSFALTPEMARDARPARILPAQPRLQPLANGLRIASGGLAAALAVVVVIAVAGGGNGSNSDDLSAARIDTSSANFESAPTGSLSQDSAATSAATAQPAPDATSTGGGSGGGSGGSGVGGADSGGGEDIPPATPLTGDGAVLPVPSESPSTDDAQYQNRDDDNASDGPKGVAGEDAGDTGLPEAGGALASNSDAGGGGASTLTVVAIVLGVLLAAALIGSIAASRLSQKTP